eukprot:s1203_g4.t1
MSAQQSAQQWKILTVKPEFLCEILAGAKFWEIRKTNTLHRGMVAFAASGTFKLWGVAKLMDAEWMTPHQLRTQEAVKSHRLTSEQLRTYGASGGAWVWKFHGAQALQKPIPWRPKRGSIIWHRINEDLANSLGAARRIAIADRAALRNAMETAVVEMREEKDLQETGKRKKRKRKNSPE